eukprot:g3844.t1
MLFLLRYRRIPHRFLIMGSPEEAGLPNAKGPVLLPKIVWPDGVSVMNDSTFLIRRLEAECCPGIRSVRPHAVHGGLGFLCDLLEDYADEFVTKAMYHYRWVHDPAGASRGIALQQALGPAAPAELVQQTADFVRERQVGRLAVVGSNETTGPHIEAFFLRLLTLLEAHLAAGYPFLLGTRPSAADFALLGQIHPMIALDAETSRRVRAHAPRVVAWYAYCTDLSGLAVLDERDGWIASTAAATAAAATSDSPALASPASAAAAAAAAAPPLPPPTLTAILAEIGRLYVPFLLANAAAIERGDKEFSALLDGGKVPWRQPAFKYQAKCLRWLRDGFAALTPKERRWVEEALAPTGCLALFARGEPEKTRSERPRSRI